MTPSARQLLILQLYEKDPNVKSVASKLQVSPKTIEFHLAKLKQHVGCTAREGLISWAFRSGLVYLLLLAPVIPAKAQLQSVTFYMQLAIDNTQMAGLSTNDYLTNVWVVISSSTSAATPTNQYPVIFGWPATQFTNQGLPPVTWTNQVMVDSQNRFYLLSCTNGNGASSPFSSVVPFFWTAPTGRVSLKH